MFDQHTPIAVILVPNVLTTCLGLKQHTNQYHPSFQAHTKDSPSWGCCLLFTFSMLILSRSDLLHHELAVIVVELLAPEQLFKRAHDSRRPGQDFRFGQAVYFEITWTPYLRCHHQHNSKGKPFFYEWWRTMYSVELRRQGFTSLQDLPWFFVGCHPPWVHLSVIMWTEK